MDKQHSKKLLLLDCDGTIREPLSASKFIRSPRDQHVIKGASEAIQKYYRNRWQIYGISNQAGVAARHKTLGDAIEEQKYTLSLLPQIIGIYFCPDFNGNTIVSVSRESVIRRLRRHYPYENIQGFSLYQSFRKPGSGMIMFAIDALVEYPGERVLMVGDRQEDQEAAAAANVDFMWAKDWRVS